MKSPYIAVVCILFTHMSHAITCESGYYAENDICNKCPPVCKINCSYNIPSEDSSYKSMPGATSESECYINIDEWWWVAEKNLPGFWKSNSRCFYNPATKIYDICYSKKYFVHCKAGYYIDKSTPMNDQFSNSCQPCTPGTYNPSVPGWEFYYDGVGLTSADSCTPAPVGTYIATSMATAPTPCPDGYTDNPATGATDIGQCMRNIPAGYYINTTLQPCTPGTYIGEHLAAYNTSDKCHPLCNNSNVRLCSEYGCVHLYDAPHTSPKVHIMYKDKVCYVNLMPGQAQASIHVQYNDTVYHMSD